MFYKANHTFKYTLFTSILLVLFVCSIGSAQYCKQPFQTLSFTLPLDTIPDNCNVNNITYIASEPGVVLNTDTIEVTSFPINSNNFLIPGVLINVNIELDSQSEEETCERSNIELFYQISFAGRSPQCPITRAICKGEEASISTLFLGVIPPAPDENPWEREYILTDEYDTIVYNGSSYSVRVSPQKTTAYTFTWNDNSSIPPTGIGYFLVEVEDCDNETDLEAVTILNPTEVSNQNPTPIFASWYNNGPGFVSSTIFVLEINGAIIETQNWEGAFEADSEMTIRFNSYSFEPGQANEIRIWSENPGGFTDLNLLNDTLSYSLPIYAAEPDLALTQFIQPSLPITSQSALIELLVESYGNVFVDNFIINWSLNGEDQTSFAVENANWTNGETIDEVSLIVEFETENFDPAIDNKIVAWVTLPDGQTDTNPDNDQIELFYSAANANYYNADSVITICKGRELSFEFSDSVETQTTCCECIETLQNPAWLIDNSYLSNKATLSLIPEESTFLSFNAISNLTCERVLWPFYPPYACRNPPGPGVGYVCPIERDTIEFTYGIIVLDCLTSSFPPGVGTFSCE